MNTQEFILEILELDCRIRELKIIATQIQTNPLFMDYIYKVSKVMDDYKRDNNLDELFLNLGEYLSQD